MNNSAERVRALNDDLRRSHRGGLVVLTPGVRSLDLETVRAIGGAVSAFDEFDPDNDPYDEHDFGAVTVGAHVVFFKIDYYDLDLKNLSPEPADPDVTRRVMTLMLAEEY